MTAVTLGSRHHHRPPERRIITYLLMRRWLPPVVVRSRLNQKIALGPRGDRREDVVGQRPSKTNLDLLTLSVGSVAAIAVVRQMFTEMVVR